MKTSLFINDVFEALEVRYRLLHVAEAVGKAYVIQLDEPNACIEGWALEQLEPCRDMPDLLRRVADPFAAGRTVEPRAMDIIVRARRYERLKGIVHYDEKRQRAHPDLWEPEGLRRLLKTHAARVNTSEKTLLHDLRLWLKGGQNLDALLGNYFNCGRIPEDAEGRLEITEKSRNGDVTVVFAPATHKARGRRPKKVTNTDQPRYEPFPLPAALRKQILEKAKEHYLEDKSRSVYGAAVAVLDDLFAYKDAEGNPILDAEGKASMPEEGKRPSVHQVRRVLEKALPVSKAFVERHSAAEYENNHAPSTGSVLDDCTGPGDVFEIDSTTFDMWVCAKANRAILIGKPTLYLVIDRGSRLIVGFLLTLDPPSWSGGQQAILSIGGDWEALCKRLGVSYRASDWPAQGVLCNRFFGDRGDMISYGSDIVCDGLTVQITNAPALLSRRKPIVETGFLSAPVPMKQDAAGYEPPVNAIKRRAKKYHRDGAYTLDELARLIVRLIIRHNRREVLGYQQTPEDIMQGLSVSPIAIWNREKAQRMGALARMPLEMMRRKMRPTGEAVVKNDGIHFEGLIYKFDDGEDRALNEWFVRASLYGVQAVKVSYQPDLVDHIWVRDPKDDRKEYKLQLTSTSSSYAGYSFAEVKYVMAKKRDKKFEAQASNMGHDVAARQDIKAMSEEPVRNAKAAARGMTPGMRRSGSDEVRENEASARRAALHRDPDGLPYGAPGAESDPRPAAPAADSRTAPAAEPAGAPAATSVDAPKPEARSAASSSTTDPALLDILMN